VITATFGYAAPESLADAVQLLGSDASTPLAGGMTLVADLEAGKARSRAVVDLRKIAQLREIEHHADGSVRIGAMVTIADLAAEHGIPPALAAAARAVPDPQVRYRATVGGNLATADRGADLPPVLLALGATVNLRAGDRVLAVPATTYLLDRPAGLITSVDVPGTGPGEDCVAERVSDRPARPPRLVVAVWARLDGDGRLGACRIAAAVTPGVPRRLPAVEAALTGTRLEPPQVVATCRNISAADIGADGLAPGAGGTQPSGDYLRHRASLLVARAFQRIGQGLS